MNKEEITLDARQKQLKINDNIVYVSNRNGIISSFEGMIVKFTGNNRITIAIKQCYMAVYNDNVEIDNTNKTNKVSIKANNCFKLK